ncbi:hypothetical protein FGB62_3g327 [Gracilaria domingensis]|nr:hypothetical protein FGB62_3g327 [Gracilaria domingensis]
MRRSAPLESFEAGFDGLQHGVQATRLPAATAARAGGEPHLVRGARSAANGRVLRGGAGLQAHQAAIVAGRERRRRVAVRHGAGDALPGAVRELADAARAGAQGAPPHRPARRPRLLPVRGPRRRLGLRAHRADAAAVRRGLPGARAGRGRAAAQAGVFPRPHQRHSAGGEH